MSYCRNLQFEDKPDYSYLRKLFSDVMKKEGHTNDSGFDWIKTKKQSIGPGIAKSLSMTPGAYVFVMFYLIVIVLDILQL